MSVGRLLLSNICANSLIPVWCQVTAGVRVTGYR